MKRAIVASILGIAASVATSYGQGYIVMENYYNDGVNGAHYSGVQLGGQYVGSTYSADLLVSLNGGVTFTPVAGSLTGFYPNSTTGGNPLTDGAGTFLGANQTILGYTSGSAQFIVEAFNGSSYASSSIRGQSAVFTVASLQTNSLLQAGDLINNNAGGGLQPFSVVPVPEPASFALLGLGAASMMIFRRRK